MLSAPFVVVVDANVLFPFTLRDTVLRVAAAGFFQLRWSVRILDEKAMVVGWEPLVDAMPNDAKDRHVAATAVRAGAQVIVTSNLRDFAALPDGLEAQSPDAFLSTLFDMDPVGFVRVLREQAEDLGNPPVSLDELVRALGRVAPGLESVVRAHLRADGDR